MKNLTTNRPLGSATKWQVTDVFPYDGQLAAAVAVQLLNGANNLVAEATIWIRDGLSDRIEIAASIAPGVRISDGALVVTPNAVATPTGYTNAFDAWKAAVGPASRRAALETWMLSVGVAGASMA